MFIRTPAAVTACIDLCFFLLTSAGPNVTGMGILWGHLADFMGVFFFLIREEARLRVWETTYKWRTVIRLYYYF